MKDKRSIICMGDSITAGYGIDRDETAPYPAQLNKLLGASFEVCNQGVSCTCTVNRRLNKITVGQPYVLEEKYREALALKGDIYVIMLGTNDAQDGFNEETGVLDEFQNVYAFREFFKEDYVRILREVKLANPEAKLLMVKPVPVMECIWSKHQQSYLERILPVFDEIESENPSLIKVDLQKVFMEYAYEERKGLYQADGLHPGVKGAEVIAETVYKAIKKMTDNR